MAIRAGRRDLLKYRLNISQFASTEPPAACQEIPVLRVLNGGFSTTRSNQVEVQRLDRRRSAEICRQVCP